MTHIPPRVVPFGLYMAFILFEMLLNLISSWFLPAAAEEMRMPLWMYPVKTAVVLAALVWYWPGYQELKNRLLTTWQEALVVCSVGLVVYLAWVRMDWAWATQGESVGYNPFLAGPQAGVILGGIRLFGAAVVVPIMEELFWRSFLIRYLINPQFTAVPIGMFTLPSMLITVVLFGLEHNLWLAGMMAGVAYNAVLYYTRRLWPCVLAHAVTNVLLGVHVLITGEWHWW